MIKNILFDMGGVVFTQDTNEAIRRFKEAGLDTDRYLGVYGQKDFCLDLETGNIGKDEFCRRMASACHRQSISAEEAGHCWLGYISGVRVEKLRELERLRSCFHLGLLSNTNPFVMDYMDSPRMSEDKKPISHYFDSLFLSYKMGICKPDPRIYQTALVKDGMRAEETIFVDDSAANIEAAVKLGIHGLHVKTNEDWIPRLHDIIG